MEPAACRGQQVSKEPQEVAQTLNYVVQFLENRDWKIEAAYQDRQAALEVAEDLVHAPGFSKVRVVEETHDDDTGKTETKTVFFRVARQSDAPAPKSARSDTPHRRQPQAPVRPARTTDDGGPAENQSYERFFRYLALLVLSVGGIGLILLVAIFLLTGQTVQF